MLSSKSLYEKPLLERNLKSASKPNSVAVYESIDVATIPLNYNALAEASASPWVVKGIRKTNKARLSIIKAYIWL